MDLLQIKMRWLQVAVILIVYTALSTQAWNSEYVLDNSEFSEWRPHIVPLTHIKRLKRDTPPLLQHADQAPTPSAATTTATAANAASVATNATSPAASPTASTTPNKTAHANETAPAKPATGNATNDSNRTNLLGPPPTAVVTQVPILGANGTGQRWTNLTEPATKVSDPIKDDEDLPDMYTSIKLDKNVTTVNDTHEFYNSSFVNDQKLFAEYWANITRQAASVHNMLSNSHRRATTVTLSFLFPFYGKWIQNITVATGGFVYTGEHTHAWLAATQYIAPLMANFDTSLSSDSAVKLADDGEKFTAFWENVTLHEEPKKPFTFAVTLHKNGDIVFAYKNIPLHIPDINDNMHPVKIGISDAYLTDKIIFYVRRKTIYEYHRASFKHYEITNGTILRLTALPTCLQYSTCDACLTHTTSFNCTWCETIQKCSSGTDRNKQDWQLRNCDKTMAVNVSSCPATHNTLTTTSAPARAQDTITKYHTDPHGNPYHDAVVNTLNVPAVAQPAAAPAGRAPPSVANAAPVSQAGAPAAHSALGGLVAAFVAIALVCSLAAWALYAFKNPHTRSGQLLIKYRPSQWNWRRGEARYTAATIHM